MLGKLLTYFSFFPIVCRLRGHFSFIYQDFTLNRPSYWLSSMECPSIYSISDGRAAVAAQVCT
jgi:hypothetical protein